MRKEKKLNKIKKKNSKGQKIYKKKSKIKTKNR